MATLGAEPTTAPVAESGVVMFAAAVPLNLVVRISGAGSFEVRGPSRGTELPAGVAFAVPAHIADAFEQDFGPRPGVAGVSPAAQTAGRIGGLRRLS